MAKKRGQGESKSPAAASPASTNGADPEPQTQPQARRLGRQAALNRAADWRQAHPPLTADQDALLALTARLYCHALNLSNRLYRDTELKADGDVRAAVKTLLQLDQRVRQNLQALFGEGSDGDISSLFQRGSA